MLMKSGQLSRQLLLALSLSLHLSPSRRPLKTAKRVWTIHTAIWRLAYSSSLLLVQNAFAAAVTRHAIQTKGPDHSIPDRQWSKLLYSRLIQYSLAVIAQALMNLVYL